MEYVWHVSLLALGLLCGMLGLLELGRRIGIRCRAQDAEGASAGLGAVEGVIFALLGLLIAFTFSGAASRFDSRRQLLVEETNAIGTAYLRIDLLPPSAQPPIREAFRRYVDARLEAYRKLPDALAAKEGLAGATALQGEIWTQAVTACRAEGNQSATMLLLPALNQMIDITTSRTMATQMHPPTIIFVMLALLALASSLLAGYGMAGGKTRSWIHIIGFTAIVAITMYVILDLEYPRLGLIRVDASDQAMVELRQSMK
jgi:hypothetical protein